LSEETEGAMQPTGGESPTLKSNSSGLWLRGNSVEERIDGGEAASVDGGRGLRYAERK